jgi:hypothetical protein
MTRQVLVKESESLSVDLQHIRTLQLPSGNLILSKVMDDVYMLDTRPR